MMPTSGELIKTESDLPSKRCSSLGADLKGRELSGLSWGDRPEFQEPFLKDDASGYHLLRSVEKRKRVWDWNPFPGRTTVEGKFGWFGESG